MYSTKANFSVSPKTFGGFFEDVFNSGFPRVFHDDVWSERTQVPANISETDTAYELHLVAPGLNKEEFKVNVDKNILHISYEHKTESNEQGDNKEQAAKWLRKEYKLNTFRRSFTLNDKVNVTGISAKYTDGVLVVTLPKKEQAAPEQQEIKID